MRPRVPVWVVLSAVVVAWGAAFSGIKIVLDKVDPFALTTVRIFIAAVTYTAIFPLVRGAAVERRDGDAIRLVLLGLFGAAGYHLAVNWGERFISAGLTSLIVAAMPAMVAVMAVLVLHERLGPRGTLGTAVAFAGVAILAAAGEGGFDADSTLGALVTLLAPLSWAVYTIMSKPMAARYDGVRLNLVGAWVGVLVTLPFGLAGLSDLASLTTGEWVWMFYLGTISTSGSYIAYAWALRHWPASRVAAFVYLVPGASLIWAWFLLGETPSLFALLGGAVVILGVVLVESSRNASYNPDHVPEHQAT
ncbi:MAG: DMT family transporter [Actinomycetota bacterium]